METTLKLANSFTSHMRALLGLREPTDEAGPSVEYYLAGQCVDGVTARRSAWEAIERERGESSLLLDQFSDLWMAAHFPGREGMAAREILRDACPAVELFFL